MFIIKLKHLIGCLCASSVAIASQNANGGQFTENKNNFQATHHLTLQPEIFSEVPFVSRNFGEEDWQATLAMNVKYEPISRLRAQISQKMGWESLKYFTAWEASGEAHITTITPVEYQECIWSAKRNIKIMHMSELEEMALKMQIQKPDFNVFGVGSGSKNFSGRDLKDQTFFLIVQSNRLQAIRNKIYNEYLVRGGKPDCWSPIKFYPHITVGYTFNDIHYPDVHKDLEGSWDSRFRLVFSEPSNFEY